MFGWRFPLRFFYKIPKEICLKKNPFILGISLSGEIRINIITQETLFRNT